MKTSMEVSADRVVRCPVLMAVVVGLVAWLVVAPLGSPGGGGSAPGPYGR